MLKNKIYFITIATAFLFTSTAFGQLFKKSSDSYSTVGIGGGSSHYFGDLSPYRTFYYGLYSNVRWNGTLNYQVNLNPRFSARAALTYARIFGNDASYGWSLADSKPNVQNARLRNLHFRNDLLEFTAMGLYTFIPLEQRRNKNSSLQWSPYMGIGIGLTNHNPKALPSLQNSDGSLIINPDGKVYVSKEWESLRPMANEGQTKFYSSVIPVIPISLGIKTQLNQNWILSVEGSYRLTFSDYLDDVSTGTYTTGSFSYRANEDYSAVTGKSRVDAYNKAIGNTGNPEFPSASATQHLPVTNQRASKGTMRDGYILTQITLNYIITSRVKCPPIQQ